MKQLIPSGKMIQFRQALAAGQGVVLDLDGGDGQVGPQGPPGPAGPAGPAGTNTSITQSFVAGEAIGSPRAVMIVAGLLYLLDPSVESNSDRIAGVSLTSASIGGAVTVVQMGQLSAPGSFVADAVYYAGPLGVLTSAVPVSGIVVKAGIAKDTGTLIVASLNPVIGI